MDYEEIIRIFSDKFGIGTHLGLRRVVGDLLLVFDDFGGVFLLLEDLEKILLEIEEDDHFVDEVEFWGVVGERGIPDISKTYELFARVFPTVRDALGLFNLHDENEIKKTLFWDEYESDLDEVILIPFSSEDGFFWFETNFVFDAPKIREYANRDAQLKILTSDGTVSHEEAEDFLKDSYLPEIEE
jgi:hypothetical protein